jgi:carboxylesterase type B
MRYKRAIPYGIWALILCSAAGESNRIQTETPKPVKVEGGLLQGTVEDGLAVYRGIPYAAPPVGELRWRPPRAAQYAPPRKLSPACCLKPSAARI